MSVMPPGRDYSFKEKSSMRESAKTFFVVTSIILFVAGFISLIVWDTNRTDTGSDCFEAYRNVYSWNYRTPELDQVWADRKITHGECKLVNEIGDDIKTEQGRRGIDAAVKEYREQSK